MNGDRIPLSMALEVRASIPSKRHQQQRSHNQIRCFWQRIALASPRERDNVGGVSTAS